MEKKILVADNDLSITSMVESLLKKRGFDVIIASDGRSAIEKAVTEEPDLVILDVMMPGIAGTEVAKIVREKITTKEIPVIFVTALQYDNADEEDGTFGPHAVIGKPFSAEDLMAKIYELI